MAESGAEPTLRGYLHVLRRGRWWIAAFAVLGLGISLAVSLTSTKQYSATAQLLVQSTGNANLTTGSANTEVSTTDVQTELQLVTSAPVQDAVRNQLGRLPSVSVAEVGQTDIIAVTAVDPVPAQAARIANTYARAFVSQSTAAAISNLAAAEGQLNSQIKAITKEARSSTSAQATALSNQQAVLKGQLAQLEVAGATASTGIELVTPAAAPSSPSSPKPVEDAMLGLLAALILGIGAAFLRDNLDDTLSSADGVVQVTGGPVLASVPLVSSRRRKGSPFVVSVSDPTSQAAEAYRSLRTSLQFARQDRPLRTMLVTSPGPDDGKTVTVANLGTVFAQAGSKVVLVSCDLRRPGLSEFAAPSEQAELSSVLTGARPLDDALAPAAGVDGLWTLGTRSVATSPTELLASHRMSAVIAELSQRFDVVLIDSPPVLPVADALILSGYVDAVLLVVAAGHTRRAELRRTTGKLAQASAPVVGVVLNKVTAEDGYGYYGAYQPYVLPAHAVADGGRVSRNGHGKGNGFSEASGQPGQHGH